MYINIIYIYIYYDLIYSLSLSLSLCIHIYIYHMYIQYNILYHTAPGCDAAADLQKVQDANADVLSRTRLRTVLQHNYNLTQDRGGPSKGGFLNNILFSYTEYIYIYIYILLHPVSITRFPLRRFSPGAGLLRNPFIYYQR